ncbi:MAG TPA: IgA Peptidase M64 [Pyrinomonadaceae bacterium]|jgi:hypothetical protein|nr:IgA Peptidase M64 [Pyrinomonadaceae bacterium]
MKRILWLALFLSVSSVETFGVETMRLDFYHTGNAAQELFSVERVVIEPLPWPGNPRRMIDESNLGKYLFEVRDRQTNRLLYSRGFASIYGEWETSDEAKTVNRTFQESLRFPAPAAPVQILLKKRDAGNAFREIWTTNVDPRDIFVTNAKTPAPARLLEIEKNGDPSTKVDLLILGDGYTAAEAGKFEHDARRLTASLFQTSPFKERRRDFNVWGMSPPAAESGVSRPSTGVHRDSPLGATYDAFGSERYILTFDNRALRRTAAFAPYDFVEILVNNNTYGGGGIFNLYSTAPADSQWASYLFIHEFAHHFAALADEYYTSPVVYAPASERVEPWEPNVTALLDPKNLKWRDLVSPDTPLPTPWEKEAFEKYSREIQARRRVIRSQGRPEQEMDALFNEELAHDKEMFAREKYANRVGAFEGANYEARGFYRPQVDCIMFTRTDAFCAVCRRAIERVVDMYSRP